MLQRLKEVELLHVIMIVIMFLWASVSVVSRYLVSNELITPLSLGFYRYLFATSFIVGYFVIGKSHTITFRKEHVIEGIILFFFIVCFGYGIKNTTATSGILIYFTTAPLAMNFIAKVYYRERFHLFHFAAIVMGALGLILVTLGHVDLSVKTMFGNMLLFLTGIFWAIYSVYTSHHMKHGMSITSSMISFLVAVTLIVPFEVALGGMQRFVLNPPSMFWVLFLSLMPTAFGYLYWSRLIHRLGPSETSLYQLLIPIFGSLMAW